nr:MAG TPA: hypothetical protein [Caudoviricetes sp.]
MKEIPVKLPFSPSYWDLEGLVSHNAQGALRKIHQCVLKYGNSMYDYVPITFSMFKYWAGTSKHTIQDSIVELERLNLIFINRNSTKNILYAINWEEYKAIYDRFVNLNTEARAAGAKLSKKLGLAISQIPEEDFSEISNNPSLVQKLHPSQVIGAKIAPIDDPLVQKVAQFSENGLKSSPIDDTSVQKLHSSQIMGAKNALIDDTSVQKLHSSSEIGAKFIQILDSIIAGDEICAENLQIIIANVAEKLVTAYFTQKLEVPDGFTLVETDFGYGWVQKLHRYGCKNCTDSELLVQKLHPDNNIYNNKKLSEARRDSYIRGEKEKESEDFEGLEEVESFEEVKEVESSEEVEERTVDWEAVKKNYSNYRKKLPSNPYKDKPYFPVEVLEKFICNPEECSTSPVRLFLYNFFTGIFNYYEDVYMQEEDEEDNDETYYPGLDDIDGMYIKCKDLQQIGKNAYFDTKGQIEVGMFSDSHSSIKLNMTTTLPEDLNLLSLCDWHFTEDKQGVLISTKGFRNIEADDITISSAVSSNSSDASEQYSDRARNLQYAYFLVTADKNTLTPLERYHKQFIDRFVEFDDMYMIHHYKNDKGLPMVSALSWRQFHPFLLTLQGISKEQFFQTIYQKSKYTSGQDISKVTSIFSYKDTQRLNKLLGFNSHATPDKLTEIRPNPYG